jgi:hAT family C-terminal dimerisation region
VQGSLISVFCRLFDPSGLPDLTDEKAMKLHIASTKEDLQSLVERYGKAAATLDAAPLVTDALITEYPMFVSVAAQIIEEHMAAERLVAQKEKRSAAARITMQQMLHVFLTSPNARIYRNVATVAEIALIMPISTAVVERGFSAMNLIKTELRSLLSERMLNALMLILLEGPPLSKFDFKRAVFAWYEKAPRKITL